MPISSNEASLHRAFRNAQGYKINVNRDSDLNLELEGFALALCSPVFVIQIQALARASGDRRTQTLCNYAANSNLNKILVGES